jgi:adenosylhomocysteine nucleosidase
MRALLLFILLSVAVRAAAPVEILVQGAEWLEVRDIVTALGPQAEKVQVGPYRFWLGELGGHRVAVSLTGQALVNCTIATIVAVEEFHPHLLINQGTSGAQRPGLSVNDIIVGRRCVDYSIYSTLPRAPGQGSQPLAWTPSAQHLPDPVTGRVAAYPQGFAGDPDLLALALRTPNPAGHVREGVIGSAHEVNLELDRVRWSHDTFGLDVEEMESAHVAALARAYGIRYISFRVVSDAPYDGVDFKPEAALTTAAFTLRFIANLSSPSAAVATSTH